MSLSASWPYSSSSGKAHIAQKKVNLSCLSTNTLKLLKGADLSKYSCGEQSAASGNLPVFFVLNKSRSKMNLKC